MVEIQTGPSMPADHATEREAPRRGRSIAGVAVALGLACAAMAAVLLWASEGARVFTEAAFAAVIACF